MQRDLMEVKLDAVRKARADGLPLPSDLLPTHTDIMRTLTGGTDAVSYLVEVVGALWDENQRVTKELEDIKVTLLQNNIYGPIKVKQAGKRKG